MHIMGTSLINGHTWALIQKSLCIKNMINYEIYATYSVTPILTPDIHTCISKDVYVFFLKHKCRDANFNQSLPPKKKFTRVEIVSLICLLCTYFINGKINALLFIKKE